MKLSSDSCFAVLLGVLLLAGPADAATTKKAKLAPKPAAVIVDPQPDPAILIAQARDAQSRGETELALRLAQSAIVADPAHPSSYDALGDVYAANKDVDFARSYYNEALSIDPTDGPAQRAIAALDHGGNDQQAAKADDAQGMKTGTP